MKNQKICYLPLLFLVACVSTGNQFTGKTLTDNILRADVMREIRKAERYTYNCSDILNNVHAEVKNIKKTGNPNQPVIVDELWLVTTCGNKHYYPINLRSDARGETDFSIIIGEKTQMTGIK